jgi:hypothetical protein
MIKYFFVSVLLLVTAASASHATDRIDCGLSMVSMDAPAFAQTDLTCWRNISGDYIYDFVQAKKTSRTKNTYFFIGLADAKKNNFMNFEPDVQTIIKTTTPKTYQDARRWSDDHEVKTKYPVKATFAEFRAWDMNCFGFVQYSVPKQLGYKFLLSGVNCEDRRRKVVPQDVVEFINQIDFSE